MGPLIIIIINFITSIGKVFGILTFFVLLVGGAFLSEALIFGIIGAIIGLPFGIWACAYSIAPRAFWVLSKVGITETYLGIVLGYIINFFFTGAIVGFLLWA